MTYSSNRPDEPNRMAEAIASTYSVPDLVAKLFREITDLFRKEGQLIRSEMSDKVSQLQVGLGKIASGAIILLVALIILAQSLVIAVANLIGPVAATQDNTGWGALIVGAIFAAIGAFLVRSGTTDLNVENLTPDRTAIQLGRDTELAKEQIR